MGLKDLSVYISEITAIANKKNISSRVDSQMQELIKDYLITFTAIKLTLDPVGSTVRYEMMKLFTGSV